MRLPCIVRWVVANCFAAVLALSAAHAADPKPPEGPIAAGDLAEYTSGFGPTVGEVTGGPDPSGYYALSVPGSGEVFVHAGKLRLIQRAGAARAAFKPGDVVDLRSDSGALRATVVKINGGWCQLEAPGTVGWADCAGLKAVRRAGNAAPDTAAKPEAAPPAAARPARADKGGGSPLKGTYVNADGAMVIEFLPKGKAFFSMYGMSQPCTHRGNASSVTLTCDGDDLVFTVDEDGALAGPPDSFVARMKKK